jgi:hypothetical protein
MSDTKATDKVIPQLPPQALQGFDYVSQRHDALIPNGVKPEDMLNPAFWAHQAVKLAPWHEIRARAEDGTWVANLLVLDCSRTWAKVKQLSFHSLTTADVAISQASETEVKAIKDLHKVVHRGPHKWSVVRNEDKAVLVEGIEQRDGATEWLDKHARAQVGGAAATSQPAAVAA